MKPLSPVILCFALTLALSGCNREQETPPAPKPPTAVAPQPAKPAPTTVLLQEPLDLQRGETLADALPVWWRFAAQKPTLLLLSNDPALVTPPDALRDEIAEHMDMADDNQVRIAGDPQRSNPLFLPGMSVDIALHQGWLGGLTWAFPMRDKEQQLNLDTFREQLQSNNLADEKEAASLHLDGNVVTGTLRSAPFHAGTLASLPPLNGPILVHIDLSYFQRLYKNEIATPVLPLVDHTLKQLAALNLPVVAVTFSYSHADSGIPLDVRFIGEFINEIMKNPAQLQEPMARPWQIQNDILYLENFFQKDEILRLVEAQAQLLPETAFVAYNRYHIAALRKEGGQALTYLAQAITLDRYYAGEYLLLAQRAYDAKQPRQALRMLQLAATAWPEHALLKVKIAELALELGDNDSAQKLLEELSKRPWSPYYYPEMANYLKTLADKSGR